MEGFRVDPYGDEVGQGNYPQHRADVIGGSPAVPLYPPPPYSPQAPVAVPDESLFHTLSILEGTWTFQVTMDRQPRLFGSTEEQYGISFMSQSGRNFLALQGSKAVDKLIRFQNTQTGTFVFSVSSKGSGDERTVLVNLPSGFPLGKAGQRTSSIEDKISDLVFSKKFATKTTQPFTKPSNFLIRDASTKEEFARIEKSLDKKSRTLFISNPKTTPVEKALFLGCAILRLKRQFDPTTVLSSH